MKRTYVVTGAASGIGQATATLLRNRGHRVIGVDLRSVDVVADLSTPEGRQDAIDGFLCEAGRRLDAVIANAGLASAKSGCTYSSPDLNAGVHSRLRRSRKAPFERAEHH